jgi:hypothetical protein
MRLLAIPLLGLVVLLLFRRRLLGAALLVVASAAAAALPLLRHDRLAATRRESGSVIERCGRFGLEAKISLGAPSAGGGGSDGIRREGWVSVSPLSGGARKTEMVAGGCDGVAQCAHGGVA